ncbi:MAG TPA: glycosyltransferase [Oscillospiraceae bacterium]|nr:glycosyltransferase [Oscillospiraceae bacterium]HPF56053.1 glycosyltransferase [Clostridiales bacterium]HPK36382.1 glycosyltransferase [Oscillospiraceae bacterium]HPR75758.1 glycosyltransferase [Oscillospiraceae bacterium]
MKVLQVNTVCTGASTATISVQLAQLVAANGGESLIAYGRGKAAPSVESLRIEKKSEFLLHVLLSRLTDRQGFFSSAATRKFCDFIRAYNPDVIHLHNLHGYYLNIKILFETLVKMDKPVVWTLHDSWAFTGHCAYPAECEKWKTGCEKCQKIKEYPRTLIDRSARNFEDKKRLFTLPEKMTIVTPSNWLAGQVRQSFLAKYPVKVIHNGIDLNVFKPTPSDFRDKHGLVGKYIILGLAARWDKWKGLDVMINLSKQLDPEKYVVVLVGTNGNTDRELPPEIISIHRTQNQKELAEIYSTADVFANPTRAEVFGLVNAEALACGTPIVTFDTGGCSEIPDKTCGSVVPCDDFSAFANEIIRVCETKPFSREGCAARARCFDKNVKFSEYIELYRNVQPGTVNDI